VQRAAYVDQVHENRAILLLDKSRNAAVV
jgi:hypothetical protein